ncbi:MAG: ABC transporter ATP-binding protein/permease [Alphaproteobacteria bacterium]|uniref:ABC transporter ATP-binding protein/permease n=1 Tax=Candidatus Nitrobium versatile TaxID=2884831 RepID=A0A953J3H2_9BACT|nr:ABC transporter ATP-binding protein/permease [Candidatus Nitrobium versatile]
MALLKRIALLVKPYWMRLVAAAFLSLLISGLNGGLAWLVKPALDGIFLRRDAHLLALLPLGILALYLMRGFFAFFQSYLMRSTGAKVMRDIRNSLYRHVLYLPVNEFKKESSGLLLSRVINDAGQLQGLVAYSIKDIFVETATVLVLLSVAFYRRWDLALISVTVLPAALYGTRKLGKRLKKVSTEGQKKISLITEFLTETFSGIKMVKIFEREGVLAALFREKNQGYYRELMRSARLIEFTSLMMEVVGGMGIAFVLWYGGRLVVREVITPGEFFSFLTAIFMVYTPARRLATASNGLQQAKAYLERLDELFCKEREADGAVTLAPLRREIEFRNVSFTYPNAKGPVLSDITLTVKRGEIIALVGRSGAGKTSFIDLIPRFNDPTKGGIFIDGVNIAEASLPSLRGQIGLVSQDIILFNDTVRANIAFGNPAASEEEIVRAAQAAHAHDFILDLPKGYDTVIGERGVMISGGQRQRISIARAILKNPPLLILDEATSSLDTESEMIVQKALDTLMENRTTFVIAHRLSTVQKADRIIVLEKGRILESGSHEDLLRSGGMYRKLHDLQLSSAGYGR